MYEAWEIEFSFPFVSSAANITGTFEHPTCDSYPHPQYFGHYLGHYLSATAQMYASTGSSLIRSKSQGIIKILRDCQVHVAPRSFFIPSMLIDTKSILMWCLFSFSECMDKHRREWISIPLQPYHL